MPSNKKIGNDFEADLCEILFENGFWVHNLAQNQSGQPADVIAARNQVSYLIDCKVCSTHKGFDLRRMEENQSLAMSLWKECGNGEGWFAFRLPTQEIFMIPHIVIEAYRHTQSHLSLSEVFELGTPLVRWMLKCK